jgi:uncharacterized protein YggE
VEQGVQVDIREQVQELKDQELPLLEAQAQEQEVLEQALALGQEQAQALLEQAQVQVLRLVQVAPQELVEE